jgi:hypothetical protein
MVTRRQEEGKAGRQEDGKTGRWEDRRYGSGTQTGEGDLKNVKGAAIVKTDEDALKSALELSARVQVDEDG